MNSLRVPTFSIVNVADVTIFFEAVEYLQLFRLLCRLKDVFIVIGVVRNFMNLITAVELVLFLATTRAAVRICLVSFIFGLCCFVIKVAVFRI